MFLRIGMALLTLSAGLAAQAIVEYSLGTAAAAGAAGAAQQLGKNVAAKMNKVGETLPAPPRTLKPLSIALPGASPVSASAPSAARPAAEESTAALLPLSPALAAPPAPAVSYEDPAGIQEGMDYTEVVRRFGPPSMKYSSADGQQTLCYTRPDRSLDLQLRDGKVAAIRRSGQSESTVILR